MRIIIASLVSLVATAASQAQVTNSFATTVEGWRRAEYFSATKTWTAPTAAAFTNARGNPPGALTAPDGAGDYFTLWAPDEYLGDQSAFVDGEIIADLTSSTTGAYNPIAFTFALRTSGGPVAVYTAPVLPHTSWTTARAPLTGSLGWRDLTTGAPISDEEFAILLEDLSGFSIMGDYKNTSDTTDVDNVYFGPKQIVNPIEFFNTNAAGWTIVSMNEPMTSVVYRPVAANYLPTGGVPGGAIQTADVDDNYNFALAPRAFGGDYQAYANGEFSFDIKNTPTSGGSAVSGEYPLVILTGGGQKFFYSAPLRATFVPTGFTKCFVPLQVSPNWHVGTKNGPKPTAAQFAQLLRYIDSIRIRTEFYVGDESDVLDNVTIFKNNLPTAVSGHVDLGSEFIGDPTGLPVRIGIFRDTWPMGEIETTLNASGNYTISCPSNGNVTLTCKASHWLRSPKSASFLGNGTPQTVDFSLANGDVDDDNAVTLFDYLILSEAFDTETGNSGFDPRADLDGDGVIGLFDYLILSDHFDQEGTPFG